LPLSRLLLSHLIFQNL